MLRRTGARLQGRKVAQRREWEDGLAKFLTERHSSRADRVQQRFDRVYKARDYRPVEEAFPLSDVSRWEGLVPPKPRPVATQPEAPYTARVALLGPPNSGKSSLMNALTTAPVSAAAPRAGTTRDWVQGASTFHDTQLRFLDTPGLFRPRSQTERRRHMPSASAAWDSLFCADVVVLTAAVGIGFVEREHRAVMKEVAKRAASRDLPLLLAVTKMDTVVSPKRRELYTSLRADIESLALPVAQSFEVSSRTFKGVLDLKDALACYGRPGDWALHRHESTTMNDAERAHELVKQVFFELLPHQVPHVTTHRVVGWTPRREEGYHEAHVEVFFDRPAFLHIFYAKLEAVSARSSTLLSNALHKPCRVMFQCFVTPGGTRG